MPAASWPSTIGSGSGQSPFMMCQSLMHTPAALTCTRTSPAFGPSCSRSRICSGLLTSVSTAARMAFSPQAGSCCELDELGRHGQRQPHAVRRAKETSVLPPTCARHGTRSTTGTPVPPADPDGGRLVRRQVHVLATSRLESARRGSPRTVVDRRAVEQDGGRLARLRAPGRCRRSGPDWRGCAAPLGSSAKRCLSLVATTSQRSARA